jgi:hypothetical protein
LDVLETIPNIPEAKRSKIESVKKKYTDFVKRRRLDFTIDRSGPLVETNHWSNPGESQNFLSLVFSFETCRNNISHDCTIMGMPNIMKNKDYPKNEETKTT